MKNYYDILELNSNDYSNITSDEIKKAYRKLAMKYHPDKNIGNEECTTIFQDITTAYEVLIDDDKRKQYNYHLQYGGEEEFNVSSQNVDINVNDFLQTIFSSFKPFSTGSSSYIYSSNNIFEGQDVRFSNIFESVRHNDSRRSAERDYTEPFEFNGGTTHETIHIKNNNKKQCIKPNDIIQELNVSIKDVLNKKMFKIPIKRIRKHNGQYIEKIKKYEVYGYVSEYRFINDGNMFKKYKERGDVIIKINIVNDIKETYIFDYAQPQNIHMSFYKIKEYDLFTIFKVAYNDLLNGFTHSIELPNNEIIYIENLPLVKYNSLIRRINNNGLPYQQTDETYMFNTVMEIHNWCRGNLYILYEIDNNIILNQQISLNNTFEIAYNASINDIL